MSAETAASLLGVAGSVLLAVPVWRGLRGRRAFEVALNDYDRAKSKEGGATTKEITNFETARDTFLVESLGGYKVNRRWTLWGLGALAASFLLALC